MKLSNDLTLVLIRSNGAPRTFNLPLPRLKRNILLLALLFVGLLSSSVILAILYLHDTISRTQPVVITETDKAKIDSATELGNELAKVQAALEGRKKLATDSTEKVANPLHLLGPTSVLANDPPVLINKPLIKREPNSHEVTIEFELQNRFPDQNRIRGYIVILAKTPNGMYVYPEGAFSTDENILLNFAKGETFGISRFRSTVAKFNDIKAAAGKLAVQIFIFSSTGQILNTLHVEENQG